jgi:hypothetical protein
LLARRGGRPGFESRPSIPHFFRAVRFRRITQNTFRRDEHRSRGRGSIYFRHSVILLSITPTSSKLVRSSIKNLSLKLEGTEEPTLKARVDVRCFTQLKPNKRHGYKVQILVSDKRSSLFLKIVNYARRGFNQ